MASTKLPWDKLWPKLWDSIPDPLTDGRLIVALDDFINPKTGKKNFGCSHIFYHAAKSNQSKYPWAQNVVLVGLLTFIKGRWACLPFAHRFYLPQKALTSKSGNMNIPGKTVSFKTKLEQAVDMLVQLAHHLTGLKFCVLVIAGLAIMGYSNLPEIILATCLICSHDYAPILCYIL